MSGGRFRNLFLSLSLLVVSLVVSMLLGELIVRSVAPQNLSGSWRVANETGLLVNKSSGTARHQCGERVVEYAFFEPHLRDTPIGEEGARVLVLGDSYTFGWLIDKQNTFVNVLQEYADAEFGAGEFQFLNAGAGGAGAADYVAYVEDVGDTVKPDIVLVFINTDDIGRSIKKGIYTLRGDSPGLKRHVLGSSRLKKAMNSIPGYQWLLERSHLMQIARTAIILRRSDARREKRDEGAVVSGPKSLDVDVSRQRAIALGEGLFARLNEWCRHRNVMLVVTTTGWHSLEDWHNIEDAKLPGEPTKAFMSVADDFFKKEHIPFVDISPHVSAEIGNDLEEYIIIGDGHPNERAHKVIGRMSWQYLIKTQLAEYYRANVENAAGVE